jgi:hypothetical protein
MMNPQDLLAGPLPICIATSGLYRRTGVWACARGLLYPEILVDRAAETRDGWEALMFHEALHVRERHALIGLLILILFAPAWPWWRREQEVRADAFALWGAGREEFWAFLYLHPHPTGRFARWCYGRSREHRAERAERRARRYGWDRR